MISASNVKKPFVSRGIIGLTAILIVFFCCAESFAQEGDVSDTSEGAETTEALDEMMGMYFINPQDRVKIDVYAGERLYTTYERYVSSDGSVYLPYMEKDVKIGWMKLLEAEILLETLSRDFIKDPRIVITLIKSNTNSVSTYGKIRSSNVELITPMRILQLIARAGGPMEDAREDSVRVISMDGQVRYFDYFKVNKNPTEEANFFLRPGDIVYIPGDDDFEVMVLGSVQSPKKYAMKEGELLLDALLKAGSWTNDADLVKVRILRITNYVRHTSVDVKEANLELFFNKGESRFNFALEDGDVIYVPTKKEWAFVGPLRSFTDLLQSVIQVLLGYYVLKTK